MKTIIIIDGGPPKNFNTPAILTALDNFQKKLDVLRGEIASGDYDAFQREFARGKELRDAWLVKHMRNK